MRGAIPRGPLAALLASLLTGACATMAPAITGDPAVNVTADGETTPVGTADADAADDPAIWRNPADPARSLIVATDKRAGLYVYGMDGRERGFIAGGELNNVDLATLADGRVIAVASDRNDRAQAALHLHRLDTASGTLSDLGTVPGGTGEAYGLCLGVPRGNSVPAFSVLKDGTIHEIRVDLNGAPRATVTRTMAVPTQPEGCVVDPRDGTLYVGEEDAGIWRFPAGATTGTIVAPVDNAMLVADIEGLALIPEGADGGLLVASSQGDDAYAVFRLPDMAPVGRFRIGAGAHGSVEETDGIALAGGDFGPAFPAGLFVAQDGDNAPAAQNFKLVRWDRIRAALGLPD